jgi:hypothetical protein
MERPNVGSKVVLIGTVDACKRFASTRLARHEFEVVILPAQGDRALMGLRLDADQVINVNADELDLGRYVEVWQALATRMNPHQSLPAAIASVLGITSPADPPGS